MHPPQHSPPARKGKSEGATAAAVARRLFDPPLDVLDWQRYVLDRGLERELVGGRWRWRWRTVVVTVARQNGKSALIRALIAHRLAARRGETVGALSHLRSVGREVAFDPLADAFTARRLGSLFDARAMRTNGQESLSVRATGGRLVMPSASERGAHGYSLDLAIVDEAWALRDYRVPQAITPTQVARPDPQLWVLSTAGTDESLWLRDLVTRGREGADRLALFEWSAPLELDAADVDAWEAANPAMGATIGADEIGHAFETQPPAEFERAHLNRWTSTLEAIIDPAQWAACRESELAVERNVAFGFDVALDRSWSSIAVAGVVGGRVAVELIARRPGTEWLGAALATLRERWSPIAIVAHAGGPARSIVDELNGEGQGIEGYNSTTFTASCQVIYDLIAQGRLAHRGQGELDSAVKVAGRRRIGDSWAFGRAVSTGDISALVAATVAAHRVSRPHIAPKLIVGE